VPKIGFVPILPANVAAHDCQRSAIDGRAGLGVEVAACGLALIMAPRMPREERTKTLPGPIKKLPQAGQEPVEAVESGRIGPDTTYDTRRRQPRKDIMRKNRPILTEGPVEGASFLDLIGALPDR
jgi:hypothetical protein